MATEKMTIGQRTAQVIKERAKEKGITIKQECEEIKTSQFTVRDWAKGSKIPGGYILAEMCRQGYDITYILIGERVSTSP